MFRINSQLSGKREVEFNATNFPHIYGSGQRTYIEKTEYGYYVETIADEQELLKTLKSNNHADELQ